MPALSLYSRIRLGLIKVNQYSPILHKFWKYLNKQGPVHPEHGRCWVWTRCLDKDGYGQFQVLGECKAHRVSYRLLVGEIPKGMKVLHKCDNPSCVNPAHLFLGTNDDNMKDMSNKGRAAKGETNGNSKLTKADVLEIRARYKPRHKRDGRGHLAVEFGVEEYYITHIIRRKVWKHI